MHIDILAIGSHGDVQPYVALGIGLKIAGYRVRVVTLDGFESLVRRHGLDHASIGASPYELANSEAGQDWVEQRTTTVGFLRGFTKLASSLIESGMAKYWQVGSNTDALIVSPTGLLVGLHIAERLGIPMIRAQLAPSAPTHYDWAGQKTIKTAAQGYAGALLGWLFRYILWSKLRHITNKARESILALDPLPLVEPFSALNRRRIPLLDGYSPVVVTRPPDWGDWIRVTGYWFLDDAPKWAPPNELTDFLSAGTSPIYVGFGSTPFPGADSATDNVIEALARTRRRAVLAVGGSGLSTGRLSDDIFCTDFVPHNWLFPKVSAAVHHGGAGVTGAALRAGIPSVVVPVFADQPFWANRLFRLGAAPEPIPAKELTEDALATAIRATSEPQMQNRAAALGDQIRQEDGVGCAVDAIDTLLGAQA